MSKQSFKLVFPSMLIKEPIMFLIARDHDLTLNIRRAKITPTSGEATVEFEGDPQDIEDAVREFKSKGVIVETVIGEEGL
ncbi:MAG: ferredoxin [Candidatus Omnitrophica bacterium]|nr:ferredoxin [Candidatus Omnitrophota bacterium]